MMATSLSSDGLLNCGRPLSSERVIFSTDGVLSPTVACSVVCSVVSADGCSSVVWMLEQLLSMAADSTAASSTDSILLVFFLIILNNLSL